MLVRARRVQPDGDDVGRLECIWLHPMGCSDTARNGSKVFRIHVVSTYGARLLSFNSNGTDIGVIPPCGIIYQKGLQLRWKWMSRPIKHLELISPLGRVGETLLFSETHPSQGECLGWPVDNVSMVAAPCSIFADLGASWFVAVLPVWVAYCSSVGAVFRLPASRKTSHRQHCCWLTRTADSRVQTSWRMPRRCLKWKR